MHLYPINHIVKWMLTKPEFIAYLRVVYSKKAPSDWVGELEGAADEDYREMLRTQGISLPPAPTPLKNVKSRLRMMWYREYP